jgi:hypothetical protein
MIKIINEEKKIEFDVNHDNYHDTGKELIGKTITLYNPDNDKAYCRFQVTGINLGGHQNEVWLKGKYTKILDVHGFDAVYDEYKNSSEYTGSSKGLIDFLNKNPKEHDPAIYPGDTIGVSE